MLFMGKSCDFIVFLTVFSVLSAVGARHVDFSEEAPSTPVCTIQGKAEKGENISLSCHSEKGSPSPSYRWDARDVRNRPRYLYHRATIMGGNLTLYDITRDTSGYYTCTSRNKFGSATCKILLTVLPPSASVSFTLGVFAGVIAGAAASVALSPQTLLQNGTTSVLGETNAN
ncbi:cell surface A33 antigen-like [Gouania willdenowi]|uniref:Cell surface A33 antigen-like n=1 Tax=Gouania willdenowi TaxID=441366 RepID=A0A8C5HRN1_GOUWI|nr:cell surface A33 antigen-like [Gouania willdenowi]